MDTTHQTDIDQLYYNHAKESGLEAIENAAAVLRRAAEDMDGYARRFKETENDEFKVNPEDVLSWAVTSVGCLSSNMRLDLFVHAAANLAARRLLLEGAKR